MPTNPDHLDLIHNTPPIYLEDMFRERATWMYGFSRGLRDSAPFAANMLLEQADSWWKEADCVRDHPEWYLTGPKK